MATLESKHYVASDRDIHDLVQESVTARDSLQQTRTTYMRALIGTTQAELKAKNHPKDEQRRVLARVQKRFYDIVKTAVATPDIASAPGLRAEEKTRRSLERNRRSNFARTAYATVRGWLRGGNDLLELKVDKVTKSILQQGIAPKNPHKPTTDRAQAKAQKYVANLIESLRPLAAVDAFATRSILEEAMKAIAKELKALPAAPKESSSVTELTDTRILRGARLRKKAA